MPTMPTMPTMPEMKTVFWMAGVSALTCLAAVGWFGTRVGAEVVLGMLAPLIVTVGTWVLIEQTYRRAPERVTGLMVAGFAGKMVFFGVYVAAMLKGLGLQPVPFVVSFTSYFIVLYVMEAFALRRLFAGGPHGAR
jgi:hypothetical protein